MPFATSEAASITTTAAGSPDALAFISFGTSAEGTAETNGSIDITNQPHLFFSVPRDGVITDFSASFSSANGQTFSAEGATITAQVYLSENATSNIFQPEEALKIELALPETVTAGQVYSDTLNNLNVAVTAGQRLLLVYSITTPDAVVYTADFYANAGVAIA